MDPKDLPLLNIEKSWISETMQLSIQSLKKIVQKIKFKIKYLSNHQENIRWNLKSSRKKLTYEERGGGYSWIPPKIYIKHIKKREHDSGVPETFLPACIKQAEHSKLTRNIQEQQESQENRPSNCCWRTSWWQSPPLKPYFSILNLKQNEQKNKKKKKKRK